MTSWQVYALTLIAQVTAISLVALLAAACVSRSASRRHTVGVLGLFLILGSPVIALTLPRSSLWDAAASDSTARPTGEFLLSTGVAGLQVASEFETNFPVDDEATAGSQVRSLTFNTAQHPPAIAHTESAIPLFVETDTVDRNGRSHWPIVAALACAIWLAGTLASIAVWIGQRTRLTRLIQTLNLQRYPDLSAEVSRSDAARRSLESVARDVCDTVGLNELPPIASSPMVPMPLVLGVWKPVIVLPGELLQEGAKRQLREVLIHEAAHIVRRDAWINAAQRLASALWWWHPGVHRLNRVVARSREEVCDNFVLGCGDAPHYAQTLLDLAEKCVMPTRLAPSLGLLESRWTLESRISDLLNPARNTLTRTERRVGAAFALLLGIVALLIGGAQAFEAENGLAVEAVAVPVALAMNVVSDEQSSVTVKDTDNPSTTASLADGGPEKLHKVIVRGRCLKDASERIAGTITIAGARVLVVRRSRDFRSQSVVGEMKSDDKGRFEFKDVETALPELDDLMIAAAVEGRVSACVGLKNPAEGVIEIDVTLSPNPGTLSGVVRDEAGRPIAGVTVYVQCFLDEPLPGIRSAVTDAQGRYAITDLKRWTPESSRTFDPKTGMGTIRTSSNFQLKHPDYPNSTARHTAIPQEVNVTLYPPAIVEGQVVDAVTKKAAANVTVSAQGVARSGWFQTQTDADGRYRLRMTRDHYNIWAEADDRIAIAVKAIKAERGKTVSGADIPLVRGGFVVGTVFGADGRPISPTKDEPQWVAHYGPARPRTGAAVTSTPVQPDGTYRLRVAPGSNYIYLMSGSATWRDIDVEDGKEARFDIRLGEKKQAHRPESADDRLARKIREAAAAEDGPAVDDDKLNPVMRSRRSASKNAARKRPDTPTGKLLAELAEQNASNDHFTDVWCRTLKSIVDLGADATPDLIVELDVTDDNLMLRCLGFLTRAIDDKRAVPALIRAIPKTLMQAGSDMGLEAEDEALAEFMQKHDLHSRKDGKKYGFGRPVREIFGALKKLTGQSFDADELNFVFLDGTREQQQMKRELFLKSAAKWAAWWELHWSEFVQDAGYSRVNLPGLKGSANQRSEAVPGRRFKTGVSYGNLILAAWTNPNALRVFFDFDTGRAAGLPEKWRSSSDIVAHLDEIEAWAAREGFDLCGTEHVTPDGKRYYALRPLGLQVWELGKDRWKMTSTNTTFEALQAEGVAAAGPLLHFDRENDRFAPAEPATFLFRTREGTPGLLFVGVGVEDDKLKPGGVTQGDDERVPVAFQKGRRFSWTAFEELPDKP